MSAPNEHGLVMETFTVQTTPEKVEQMWNAINAVLRERK